MLYNIIEDLYFLQTSISNNLVDQSHSIILKTSLKCYKIKLLLKLGRIELVKKISSYFVMPIKGFANQSYVGENLYDGN